ncbi:MAG: glycosyltransferase family 2 protein [Gemmatimonadaceae bacterium]|nr:glycosyltransferase family 2 protein [Gemmatimonadaceae bacterium]
MSTSAPLRIGILTHNGLHHTQRCLDSLRAHTTAPWEAYVVDNASSDATPAWLAALDDPRIHVELRSDNLGVSGGRNHLFHQLTPQLGDQDLLVFLDNDIEVGPGWETPFLEAFAQQPRLGVAGHWAFSMRVHESWRDILAEHTNASAPCDTVQGCCFWVRGATARAVGTFDESLGRFWHEDDDYCIRALHAGWDVQRVRSPKLWHHEHGSGVALRPERVAGSLANQQMLAAKWRAMGALDAQGVPLRPVPEPLGPLRQALAAALGRSGPLLRTELHSALHDLARLMHASLSDDEAGLAGTPAVQWLLQQTAAEAQGNGDQETYGRATGALARLDALRRARRATCALPSDEGRGALAFSSVCQPRAWDDARWAASAARVLHEGHGTDYYARHEVAWRDGQLAYALSTAGVLRPATRAFALGHASEPLLVALSHQVGTLVVADRERPTTEQMAQAVGRPWGSATTHTTVWSPSVATGEAPYDLVVCPNLARYATATDTLRLIGQLAARLAPGGMLAVATSVQIGGGAHALWLPASTFGDDARLADAGVRRIGRFDDGVSDGVLLATLPEQAPAHWRPRLARRVGGSTVTVATLVARRR